MKRLLLVVAWMCLAAGCKSRGEAVDPFFGRTTIEPPATGACNGHSIDPYYRPTSPPTAPTATTSPPAAPSPYGAPNTPAISPNTGAHYVPPASSVASPYATSASPSSMPQSNTSFTASSSWGERVPPEPLSLPPRQTNPPPSPTAALPVVTPPPAPTLPPSSSPSILIPQTSSVTTVPPKSSDTEISLAERPRLPGTLDPRPNITPTNYSPDYYHPDYHPAARTQSDRSININDLPPPKSNLPTPAAQPPAPISAGEVRPLGEVAISDKSEVHAALALEPIATTSSMSANYSHEQDYGVLRGKLEFSQADQQWKLRYIPIDGEMDSFGGSVIVANKAALAGFERGDMVEIHGHVDREKQPDRGFAPFYEVAEVRPLAVHSSY